ncbi:hypothetical protein ACIRO3_19010 [Streptomyces sp. NPDC102278]|uniref:hypothetical protein n=1 Tax=Streptomyces sp. NPDC102278 TaxID=3366152 RepID=UPI003816C666
MTHDADERRVERRLRQALAARADEVTVVALRPAEPPGPHLRRLAPTAVWLRRLSWSGAGLVAAAAAVTAYALLAPDAAPPRPVPPAAPPEFTPSPSPSPSRSQPSPSQAPPRTPGPTGRTEQPSVSRPPSPGATRSGAPRATPSGPTGSAVPPSRSASAPPHTPSPSAPPTSAPSRSAGPDGVGRPAA